MVHLHPKKNASILLSSEKAVEIPENEADIVPDMNDHVAAICDGKVYIGKVLEINNSDTFWEHAETLSISSTFR